MNGALDTLQIVSLNVVGVFHDKALAIPNKLSIAIMASDMHMDRLVFMGKEQKNEGCQQHPPSRLPDLSVNHPTHNNARCEGFGRWTPQNYKLFPIPQVFPGKKHFLVFSTSYYLCNP